MENSQILFEMMKKMDEKLDSHGESLGRLETQVAINTKDLAHHIARTDILQDDHKLTKEIFESRISILEEPGLVSKFLSNKVVKISGITAAVYGIYKFLLVVKSFL